MFESFVNGICVAISSNLGSYHLQGISTDQIDNSVKEAVMSDVNVIFVPSSSIVLMT